MVELQLKPREYQSAIFETAKNNNTLVVLPTGLGKTFIALLLAVERIERHPGSKILFLAPTRPLVEQHLQTFKENLPELFASLDIFTGSIPAKKREETFQRAEIIFSTPQCISNDVKQRLYSLDDVSLVIIDEAHRCLKNYAYTSVVESYKNQAPPELQRILGLTASPGSDHAKVRQICRHLNTEKIESRTRDSPDVKPYLQELEFTKISVPFPKEFIEIRVLLKRIYDSCVFKLKQKNLLFGPAHKIALLVLQKRLSARIAKKDFMAISGISQTAQAIKIAHAIELLETQTLTGLSDYLEGLKKQAERKQSRAVQTLVKSPDFQAACVSLNSLLAEKRQHPKIKVTADVVEEQFKENPKSKIIIFAQFRETTSSIAKKVNQIKGVKASVFVGQAKKGNTGLSQKEQKQIIEQFREGEINVLCATSIGEEGLDIPEVSAVIFYEPIPSAIRKIQRAGRTARLAPGKLLILITKDTRDEINYYASGARERKMHKTLTLMKEEIANKSPTLGDFT